MANYTFPREVRLLTSRDYDRVFKNPIRVSAPGLSILAVKNNDLENPRLGMVIPKKVLKRAVWRNRVKRLVRESFRLSQHTLPQADLVVMAKPKIGEISNADLSSSLKRLWEQISRRLEK